MSRHRVSRYLLLVVFLPMLAACLPENEMMARQYVVEWPEQHLLFIADSRVGKVQSFFLGSGAPVASAQSHDAQRSSVRDLQLDAQRGQLWVLGDDGVSVHKARGLVLQKHISLDTQQVSTMRIEDGRVVLFDDTGERVGQIDPRTLVASWLLPDHRG